MYPWRRGIRPGLSGSGLPPVFGAFDERFHGGPEQQMVAPAAGRERRGSPGRRCRPNGIRWISRNAIIDLPRQVSEISGRWRTCHGLRQKGKRSEPDIRLDLSRMRVRSERTYAGRFMPDQLRMSRMRKIAQTKGRRLLRLLLLRLGEMPFHAGWMNGV